MNWSWIVGVLVYAIATWFIGYGLRRNMDKRKALLNLKKELKPNEGLNSKWYTHVRLSTFLIVLFGSVIALLFSTALLASIMAEFRWYACLGFTVAVVAFAYMGYERTIPFPGISIDL